MPTEQEVIAALSEVVDPELGASLIDLNMVRRIEISDGQVTVHLVLTVPGCPLVWWIVESVREAVSAVPGVQRVEVELLNEPWQPPDFGNW